MELFSVREVVEQAVQTEKLGYVFYSEMAKRFHDHKGLTELFKTLAAKEQGHEQIFLALKETLMDDAPESWEEVSYYLRAIVESEFFLGREKSLPSLEGVKTVADAVRFAIGFEKETLLYFYAVRDLIREKEAVGKIIEEEKSHIIWLGKFEMGLRK